MTDITVVTSRSRCMCLIGKPKYTTFWITYEHQNHITQLAELHHFQGTSLTFKHCQRSSNTFKITITAMWGKLITRNKKIYNAVYIIRGNGIGSCKNPNVMCGYWVWDFYEYIGRIKRSSWPLRNTNFCHWSVRLCLLFKRYSVA